MKQNNTLTTIIIVFVIAIIAFVISRSFTTIEPTEDLSLEERGEGRLCYMDQTKVPEDFGDGYNYQFMSFFLEDGVITDGVVHYYPFATDSNRGSFSGTYDHTTGVITTEGTSSGEGMLYETTASYTLYEHSLGLGYTNNEGEEYQLRQVSCDEYDASFQAFMNDQVARSLNTTDRTRLASLEAKNPEIAGASFVERPFDLDRNYQTTEYLVVPYGAASCEAGPCTLYVVSEEGTLLSEVGDVSLPLYTTLDAEGQMTDGWKSLFVEHTNGIVELVHNGTSYEFSETSSYRPSQEEMMLHPETYYMILDIPATQ